MSLLRHFLSFILGDPRARGMINITAEVVRPSKNKVSVHAAGHKLVKTGKIIMSKVMHMFPIR